MEVDSESSLAAQSSSSLTPGEPSSSVGLHSDPLASSDSIEAISSTALDKGKGKEVDRSTIRLLELPLNTNSPNGSTSSAPSGILSPRSASPRQPSFLKPGQLPARRRSTTPADSSNPDTISSAPLPLGKPLPERIPTPPQEGPPTKRSRPSGPTPLPTGPPTIQNLRILLEPEHVDLNRPKQLFDLIRTRDAFPPKVKLEPAEIKEILMKMRGVNDIWLRTMGEDEGNVQCLAGWLRLFVGSNEPKKYEGIVAPAIWVGLAFPFFFLQSHTLWTLRSLSDTLSIPIRDIVLHALSPPVEPLLVSLVALGSVYRTKDEHTLLYSCYYTMGCDHANAVHQLMMKVILKAKPPIQILRTTRLGTLAKQALEKARSQGLSKKDDIEKAVDNLDHLIGMAKKNAGAAGSSSTTSSDAPKKSLPSFKKTNSSSALPVKSESGTGSGSGVMASSAASSSATVAAGPSGSAPPRTAAPAISATKLTDLQRILSNLPSFAKPAPTPATASASNHVSASSNTLPTKRQPLGSDRVKIEDTGRPAPQQRSTGINGSGPSSAFAPASAPTPLTINRPSSASGPSSQRPNTQESNRASSSANPSYPSKNNRWSSVATPDGLSRPFDNQKKPNWRNRTVRYRTDDVLAEAREFEQDEGEEEYHPYWWIYGRYFNQEGHAGGGLDKEEGHTMKHVHGHEPAIEWYDPPVYDTTGSTVEPVYTAECQKQDERERPLLSTYYHTNAGIPPCPDETGVRWVQDAYNTLHIPFLPRAWVPPPMAMPYPPFADVTIRQDDQPTAPPAAPVSNAAAGFGSAYRHRDREANPPAASGSTSSSFRPRSGSAAPSGGGATSSAYRPRATSAPPGPDVKPDLSLDFPDRRASTIGIPKMKSSCPRTNTNRPVLSREAVIRQWRKEVRPRKSALLNPLSAQQVAENLARAREMPPQDYKKCQLDNERDDDGTPPS